MCALFYRLLYQRFIANCIVFSIYLLAGNVGATTYYVDSAGGNDGNSGTVTNAAWQTLAKVNGKLFSAGDEILFKAGANWAGTLSPLGSGTSPNPIVISSYGTNSSMPLINGNGNTDAVILTNQQFWEINNLEVINPASTDAERRGIHLCAANFGTVNHLYVSNCYVHNIRGKVDSSNGDLVAKRTGGIIVEVTDDSAEATRFNDVVIQNCTISSVTNQGVVACINRSGGSDFPGTASWNARFCSNLIIRNNVIDDICKNAMSIRYADASCLVEHNRVFDTANTTSGNQIAAYGCKGTVFQYNEGFQNHGGNDGIDGSLYDSDLRCVQTVWQYSYSHENYWGLFVQYAAAPSNGSQDTNVIVRYNISRNDYGDIFAFTGDGGATSSEYIYNNTIYAPSNLSPTFVDDRTSGHTSSFYNNIFYNLSSASTYNFTGGNQSTFDCNLFYGQHPSGEPADAQKLTSDPELVAPGTGTNGLNTLTGYQLQPNSPCIESGLIITTNITDNPNVGGLDFWSNTVPFNAMPDRGANELPPISPMLSGSTISSQGAFRFMFRNSSGAGFSVLASTNLALSATNWAIIGNVTGGGPGQVQFSDTSATNFVQRFYKVRSP